MNCPNCSREISETAKVCGYCGTRLAAAPPAPVPEPGPEPEPEPRPEPGPEPEPEPEPAGPLVQHLCPHCRQSVHAETRRCPYCKRPIGAGFEATGGREPAARVTEEEPAKPTGPARPERPAGGTREARPRREGARGRLWAWLVVAGVVVAAGAVAIVWWVNRSDGNGAITTTMAPTTAAPPTTEAGPSTTYAAPSTTAPSGGPTGFAGAWEMTDESGLNLIVVSEDAGSLVTIDVYAERADWVCSGSNPFYEEMRGSVEGNRVTAVAGWLKCLGEPAWITEFTFEWRRVGSDLVDSMERRWSASGVDPSTLYPGDPWWDAWHMQIDEAALAGARLDLGPGGGHDCRVTDQVTIEGEIVDVVECTGRIDSPTSDFHVVHGFFKEAGDTVEGFRDQWTGVELWVDGYQVPPAGYLDWTVDGLPAVSWAWMGTLHGAHRLEMVWRDHNVVVASTIVDVTFP